MDSTSQPDTQRTNASAGLALDVKRNFSATVQRVFDAWTRPEHLTRWWGPAGVTCPHAEVDLRVGGVYRIVNRIPGGGLVNIVGEFLHIEPPTLLVYRWRVEPGSLATSVVTVRFIAVGESTDLTIRHSGIADTNTRDDHERGWSGCLDGLARFLAGC